MLASEQFSQVDKERMLHDSMLQLQAIQCNACLPTCLSTLLASSDPTMKALQASQDIRRCLMHSTGYTCGCAHVWCDAHSKLQC